MRFIDQVKTALKRRTCGQCGGKGYVVARHVDEFIQNNGLAAYQAAATLMANEATFGGRGSLPVSAWELVGLTPAASVEFATEVGNLHVLHACASCNRHKDHTYPLKTASDVIEKLTANRQAAFQEWLGKKQKEPAGE